MRIHFNDTFIAGITKGMEFRWEAIRAGWFDFPGSSRERELLAHRWAQELQRALDRTGVSVTVQKQGGGRVVRVLADSEALGCNARRFGNRLQGLVRDNHRIRSIERAGLDADRRRELDSEVNYQARVLTHLANAKPDLRPQPYISTIPKLGPCFEEAAHVAAG